MEALMSMKTLQVPDLFLLHLRIFCSRSRSQQSMHITTKATKPVAREKHIIRDFYCKHNVSTKRHSLVTSGSARNCIWMKIQKCIWLKVYQSFFVTRSAAKLGRFHRVRQKIHRFKFPKNNASCLQWYRVQCRRNQHLETDINTYKLLN